MMAPLLAWLWQGMALTLGVTLLLGAIRPLAAGARYALWWAALAGVLVLPFAGALWVPTGHAAGAAAGSGTAAAMVEPLIGLALPEPADWMLAILVGAWLGLLLLGLLNLARATAHLAALKRGATPIPPDRERRLPRWLSVRDRGRRVVLAQSDAIAAPAALGFGRATVVLPRGFLDRFTDDEIDQIVLHEYAHLQRRDDWGRLAQALVRTVAGIHPAVWWIDRRLEVEREAACDDFVVRQTGAARRYAACLARAAEAAAWRAPAGSLASGVAGARADLSTRVRRLLDGRPRRRRAGLAAAALAGGCIALVAGVMTLAQSRPLVVFAAPVAVTMPSTVLAAPRSALAPPAIAPVAVPAVPEVPEALTRVAAAAAPPAAVPPPALDLARAAFEAPRQPLPTAADPPAPAATTLDATPLATAWVASVAAVPPPDAAVVVAAGEGRDRGPWLAVADAGTSVGSGVKKAGVATAGFFTRLGRSIAGAF